MKIRMLQTQRGAEDGYTVRTYQAGQEYDLGSSAGARELAAVFLRNRWAEEVTPSAAAAPPAAAAPEVASVSAPAEMRAVVPAPAQASQGGRNGRRR